MIRCKECGGEVIANIRNWWETGDEVLDTEKYEYLAKCQSCGWQAGEYTTQIWDAKEDIFEPKPPEYYFDENNMGWCTASGSNQREADSVGAGDKEFIERNLERARESVVDETGVFFKKFTPQLVGQICENGENDEWPLGHPLNQPKKITLEDDYFIFKVYCSGLRKGDMIGLANIREIHFSYKDKARGEIQYVVKQSELGTLSFYRSYLHICYVFPRYYVDKSPVSYLSYNLAQEVFDEIGTRYVERYVNLGAVFPECVESRWHEMPEYKEFSRIDGREHAYGRSCYVKTTANGKEFNTQFLLCIDEPEPLKDSVNRFGSRRLREELQGISALIGTVKPDAEIERQAATLQSEICLLAFRRIALHYLSPIYAETVTNAINSHKADDISGYYSREELFVATLDEQWECEVSANHFYEYSWKRETPLISCKPIFPYFSILFRPYRNYNLPDTGPRYRYRVSVIDGVFHTMRTEMPWGHGKKAEWETLPQAIVKLGYDCINNELQRISQAAKSGRDLQDLAYSGEPVPEWMTSK